MQPKAKVARIFHRAVKTDYKTDADVDETFKSINAEFTT